MIDTSVLCQSERSKHCPTSCYDEEEYVSVSLPMDSHNWEHSRRRTCGSETPLKSSKRDTSGSPDLTQFPTLFLLAHSFDSPESQCMTLSYHRYKQITCGGWYRCQRRQHISTDMDGASFFELRQTNSIIASYSFLFLFPIPLEEHRLPTTVPPHDDRVHVRAYKNGF